eukprot:6470266-Amphidinium_carterae.1
MSNCCQDGQMKKWWSPCSPGEPGAVEMSLMDVPSEETPARLIPTAECGNRLMARPVNFQVDCIQEKLLSCLNIHSTVELPSSDQSKSRLGECLVWEEPPLTDRLGGSCLERVWNFEDRQLGLLLGFTCWGCCRALLGVVAEDLLEPDVLPTDFEAALSKVRSSVSTGDLSQPQIGSACVGGLVELLDSHKLAVVPCGGPGSRNGQASLVWTVEACLRI